MSLEVPGESERERTDSRFSVIHLLVIGFHPRSGYRVEFCTPPLSSQSDCSAEKSEEEASDIQLPEEWECIRYLALPDGAHNHDQDTLYFSMPSRRDGRPESTVFGVSCYRQIYVTNRVGDGARGSIQKSVCILANMPIFSLLESKLRWVTEAFFDQIQLNLDEPTNIKQSASYKSQSPEQMLEICFDHIKLMLCSEGSPNLSERPVKNANDAEGTDNDSLSNGDEVDTDLNQHTTADNHPVPSKDHLLFEQLPLSELISQLGASKLLLLFKLMLLEPRVIFYGPRALPIGQLMLSVCALFPLMLSKGLSNSHCRKTEPTSSSDPPTQETGASSAGGTSQGDNQDESFEVVRKDAISTSEASSEKHAATFFDPLDQKGGAPSSNTAATNSTDNDYSLESEFLPMMVNFAAKGYPLQVFNNGNLWIPYASLHQLSDLQKCQKAYSVGCTNALFVSNFGGLSCDVIVSVDETEISFDWKNHEMKKLTHLSSEDIRFANELHQAAQSHCTSQGIDWHGGEQHIRLNFNLYLSSLLISMLSQNSKQMSCFYTAFCRAYEKTNNYIKWKASLTLDQKAEALLSMESLLHPGSLQGTRSMDAMMNVMWDDMSMRWNHISSVSQRYRKGRRAVSAAKSAFGNFLKGTAKVNPFRAANENAEQTSGATTSVDT